MFRACAALLVLTASLTLATPTRAQRTSEDFLARATREQDRGRTARAVAMLRRGVSRLPGDASLAHALVHALVPEDAAAAALDDTEARAAGEAHAALAAVTGDDSPTRHALDLELAWLRALEGDCAGASEAIARRDPRVDRAAALRLREVAALAIRRGQLQTATVALDRARAADATLEGLDLARAALASMRGQDQRAVSLLRALLARHPEDAEAMHALAGALLAAGRSDEALQLYREFVPLCADPKPCRRDGVRAALEARRFDLAREGANELSSGPAPEASDFTLLGLAEVGRGDLDAAKQAFRRALRLDPEDARARASLRALAPGEDVQSAPTPSPAMLPP